MTFRILDIIKGTTVDGPGFRTSIYFAGCPHHCEGCHNPQSWDPDGGIEMSTEEIMEIVEDEDFDVTLTGGDPLLHPSEISSLIKALKENRRNVWIYTGYKWEDIIKSEMLLDSVKEADVLVDGEFIESLKNIDLPFRGSSNQRLIDVQKSLILKETILYKKE